MRMLLASTPRSVLCCSSTPCSQLGIRTQPSLTSLLPASHCLGGYLSQWSCPGIHNHLRDVASLERMAPALQARALARCQPTDDPAADQALFDTTLTELKQGWLDGPFLAPDVPRASVISPRFYVLQSDKCRPIDDFRSIFSSPLCSKDVAATMKCPGVGAPSTFKTHTVSWQLRLRAGHTHSFACTEPMHVDRAIWKLGLGLRLFAH